MNIRNVLMGNGRPPTKETMVARGVIFLVIVTVICTSFIAVSRGALAERTTVTAHFTDAGGSLVKNADVKYNGINVGKLNAIEEAEGGAAENGLNLKLFIENKYVDDIPANVTARVMPASIFGTSFVDLMQPASPEGELDADTVIEQDTSKQTLELQTILDGLDRVVKSMKPAQLSETLGNLSQALNGKGPQIGSTIDALDQFLGQLNPQMPLVTQNLDLLAGNLDALQLAAPDLFAATENVLVTARTLSSNTANYQKAVGSGAAVFAATEKLLSDNEKDLVNALAHTAIVVDALYDGRTDLVRGVLAIGTLTDKLVSITKDNAMLRVDATAVNPIPDNYGPGDCPTYAGVRGKGC